MAKGDQRSNKMAKKPKKDTSPPKPPSTSDRPTPAGHVRDSARQAQDQVTGGRPCQDARPACWAMSRRRFPAGHRRRARRDRHRRDDAPAHRGRRAALGRARRPTRTRHSGAGVPRHPRHHPPGRQGARRSAGRGARHAGGVAARPARNPGRGGARRARRCLNGVVGDHLERTANPLAIRMQLLRREDGRDAAELPLPGPHVLLLIHGLCMNDRQWTRGGHDHGQALAQALGCTPVYARYNSGLHVSTNGRELAHAAGATAARLAGAGRRP